MGWPFVACFGVVCPGGVLSGIGKGVTASSIGVLSKMMGLRPTAIKIDPYLNVDAGTMSPFEHGEVRSRVFRLYDIYQYSVWNCT